MPTSLPAAPALARMLLEANQTAASALRLDEVLERIANTIAAALGVPDCGIYLLDPHGGTLAPSFPTTYPDWHRLTAFLHHPLDPVAAPLIREAVERRQPVACANVSDRPQLNQQLAAELGVVALLVLPLAANERVLGVAIAGAGEPHEFAPAEIELAWGIATSGALAVENVRLFEETRRRLAESESLRRVTAALLGKLGLDEVLTIVCAEAIRLTGGRESAILLREGGDALRVAHWIGVAPPLFREPAVAALIDDVLREGEPRLSNLALDLPSLSGAAGRLDSLLVAPLRLGAVATGTLAVLNKPGGFVADDLRLTGLAADQAAIAIENARLHQQVEQLAIVAERQRLSRDLHDSVAQSLFSLTLYTEAASSALAGGEPATASAHMREVGMIARDVLAEMRLLIYNLRSPTLDREGLVGALQSRLDAVEARAAVRASLETQGEDQLPPAVRQELYYIAQEALNNMLKYSRAEHVRIRLCFGPTTLMEIDDDGVGFEPAGHAHGGLGLTGMAERARRLGGRLTLWSAPGQGAHIAVEVPT